MDRAERWGRQTLRPSVPAVRDGKLMAVELGAGRAPKQPRPGAPTLRTVSGDAPIFPRPLCSPPTATVQRYRLHGPPPRLLLLKNPTPGITPHPHPHPHGSNPHHHRTRRCANARYANIFDESTRSVAPASRHAYSKHAFSAQRSRSKGVAMPMITVFRSPNEASTYEYPDNGVLRFDYFAKSSGLEFGPEAFIADNPAGKVVRAHYHAIDQFQVFFGDGNATYKNTEIPRVLLHYTDGYTTYGPAEAVNSRLKFFTLRATRSGFVGFMPEAREQLPKATGRRRHEILDVQPWLDKPLPATHTATVDSVFEESPNAMAVYFINAGPEAEIEMPATHDPGSYCVVLEGDLIDQADRHFGPMSLGWTGPVDESAELHFQTTTAIRSGPAGCKAMLLQFPPPSTVGIVPPADNEVGLAQRSSLTPA
jgi:hypothetical protein